MPRFLSFFCVALLLARSVLGQTSVPIHVSIVMHVEQSGNYHLNPILFENSRTNLYKFATALAARNVSFNFQSDWSFLAAVTNYDRNGHPETGGTNIIAWMQDTLGFDIDPHNHIGESTYNYADVAALIRLCGADPTEVAGGFIALPVVTSEWSLLQGTITGKVYTADTWTPWILWGAASGNHVLDTNLWFSGIYCPRDGTNFHQHLEGNRPIVGGWLGKNFNWTNLDQLVTLRSAGGLCTGRFYTCNIMTGMGDLLTPGFVTSFMAELEARTNYTQVRWVTISEMTNIWATEFASRPSYRPYIQTNDLDTDGLNDGWEITNFCGMAMNDGVTDHDEDQFSDLGEFIAGTSPTNSAEYVGLNAVSSTSITWQAGNLGAYVVEVSTSPDQWQAVHTNNGSGPVMTYQHGGTATQYNFRIHLRR